MSRWELPAVIETYEGAGALSGALVKWTSPFAGARSWAAGNPASPVICRQAQGGQDDQDWPTPGAEDSSLFTVTPGINRTAKSGNAAFAFKNAPDFENPSDGGGDNVVQAPHPQRAHPAHRRGRERLPGLLRVRNRRHREGEGRRAPGFGHQPDRGVPPGRRRIGHRPGMDPSGRVRRETAL